MKMLKKQISMLMITIMLITSVSPAVNVQAATINTEGGYIIKLQNNSYLQVKEIDSVRTVEYYEDGIKKQISTYDSKTQDILYYDLGNQHKSISKREKTSAFSSTDQALKPIKYKLEDFIYKDNRPKVFNAQIATYATKATANFTYLKSKTLQSSGITYYHYLYGYKDTIQYEESSWHFEAGTAISVICTALSVIFPAAKVVTLVTGAVSVVGGYILSYFTVSSWIKDYFWVYKFKRTSPSPIEIICPSRSDFVYKKERKVEINGDEGYWEVIEEKANWEIESVRDDILTNPGLYI